jgi:hypothetical protein
VASTGIATLLHGRLLGGASQLAQVWFDPVVLEKYRAAGARVMRTDSMGRLKLASWSVDFGIAEPEGGAAVIHLSIGEAQTRIPEAERSHWAAHALMLPASVNYVTVQVTHGTCVDDGDLRDW